KGELERVGRVREAQEEFDRLTRVAWGEREFDPNRYYTIEGARRLDPIGLGVLRELYELRERNARQEDRPPFKIMAESTLLHLAHAQPRTLKELSTVQGVGEWLVRRHGRGLLEAIERGLQNPQRTTPRLRNQNAGKMPDPATRDRYALLKEWRRTRAEARGVESDVIIPNDTLMILARQNPGTREALEEIAALGSWKVQEYGEEILQVLHGAK
ncbi:MAG: HRDC domain-containing protein, partial [Anaerolineae bacterium]